MKKAYRYNGVTYDFTDIHWEVGCLYGRCVTNPYSGKWAWLDSRGFQFERERRMEAQEVFPSCEYSVVIPRGCHYWGGEIRRNYGRR